MVGPRAGEPPPPIGLNSPDCQVASSIFTPKFQSLPALYVAGNIKDLKKELHVCLGGFYNCGYLVLMHACLTAWLPMSYHDTGDVVVHCRVSNCHAHCVPRFPGHRQANPNKALSPMSCTQHTSPCVFPSEWTCGGAAGRPMAARPRLRMACSTVRPFGCVRTRDAPLNAPRPDCVRRKMSPHLAAGLTEKKI